MTKATLVGFIAAAFFFFYFAYIVDGASLRAIHALAPAFKLINASIGRGYSHLLGYSVSLLIGVIGTFVFLLPIRIAWGVTPASMVACGIVIMPVALIFLFGGIPQNIEALSVSVQPLIGLALVFVQNRRRPQVSEPRPNPSFQGTPGDKTAGRP